MKNSIKLILVSFLCLWSTAMLTAQDIQASLDAAQSSYEGDQSLEARENLQQALIDLNNLIGKKILDLMPAELGNLAANSTEDNVVGGTGFAGLMVSRQYGNSGEQEINVNLANESPMLTAVNAFLSNSMLSGMMASQTGQKKITVDGYKGMLEKSDSGDGPVTYTINVPLGDSLFTFESTGLDSEGEVTAMVQKMNLSKISELLK